MRELLERVERATPAGRDRAVDGLRALAIGGVVLGHWLVTALVADSGTLRGASPLSALPQLAPASWLFQTLSVFFLVGGLVAARGWARSAERYRVWLGRRLARLFGPVVTVVAVWTVAAVTMLASGVSLDVVLALARLVWSPLWFLLVFAALTALTPLATKSVSTRTAPAPPRQAPAPTQQTLAPATTAPTQQTLAPATTAPAQQAPAATLAASARQTPAVTVAVLAAVVALVDLGRFWAGGPGWLGWVNVVAGWLVPYCVGVSWAGGMPSRRTGWVLLLGGGAATVALVLAAGYPASMVGVPGAAVSNLDPPTLAVVTFGLAQCGAARLLADPLRRALRRPLAWAAVAVVNVHAITIFLWHQTAMIAVTALGLLTGQVLPGLHTAPESAAWVAARLAWLPAFGAVLVACCALAGVRRRRAPTT
ncbi:acyltransferase family protein [Nonomuraea sp. NPDC049421]|uniref:acyltransferase family protein n=1 Tax=Nonomuraea sp. NPDC049421 TaxID=3155275 RepID=UPI003428B232